ncbi:helix-turn-helix domain-containing protein [Nonomuraea basaltis]|uniref:helix-turn-helix domain-containing protein n=1 Tax=Nonomuraea basaltis TaxID=2495887 RepID=UPI00110C5408|nr:helix-turn-helix domain-containing protein [Nonomuraea basaltis]TMR91293.1 helix-turn-helix domain-containing protein [Nonomuraea basaltis]
MDLEELDFLTIKDAAALIGITPPTLRGYVGNGDIAAYRIHRNCVRITRATVERFKSEYHQTVKAETRRAEHLTIAQTARVLHVSQRTVITMIQDGDLTAVTEGGVRRIARNEIADYLLSRKTTSSHPEGA